MKKKKKKVWKSNNWERKLERKLNINKNKFKKNSFIFSFIFIAYKLYPGTRPEKDQRKTFGAWTEIAEELR